MNGVVNVNKPMGFTSHDVVAKLRGILSTKKIGHTGTLDPDATGVLPICVGRATKAAELLTAEDKEYVAVVTLGAETDTQDASGKVLRTGTVAVTEKELRQTAAAFLGDSLQIPPMYSAVRQDGKKLYELARQGQVVERKPRPITIHALELQDIHLEEKTFSMRVTCSKGTYIRTLCNDIGERLGCFAHMSGLCRTRSGQFQMEDAVTLEEIEARMQAGDIGFLTPVDQVLSYPALYLSERKAALVRNGGKVKTPGLEEDVTYRVYDETGVFLTVSTCVNGVLKIDKTFF